MVIPNSVNNEVFATNVIEFILEDLSYLREKFEYGHEEIARPDEQKYIPFYQCIGKAATLFAVMYKDKVKLTLLQNRQGFSQPAHVLDDFVNNFSNSFLQRVENCPETWIPVIVLMYCGVFGAIADCCMAVNRPDLVDVCKINLELDMRAMADNIQKSGGWRNFYGTSSVFAEVYDDNFWNDDSDEEAQDEELAQEAPDEESTQKAQDEESAQKVRKPEANDVQEQKPEQKEQESI